MAFVACAAQANVAVTDYNWLQLQSNKVTASVYYISDDLSEVWGDLRHPVNGWNQGVPEAFRWGVMVWRPRAGMLGPRTNLTTSVPGVNAAACFGESNYCSVVTFDAPRDVYKVITQFELPNDTVTVSKYYVDGKDVNGDWQNGIGSEYLNAGTPGSFVNGANGIIWRELAVTRGDYLAIRIRLMAGDYTTYVGENDAAPGFFAINPIGDGVIDFADVNWANATNFQARVSARGMDSGWTAGTNTLNTGTLLNLGLGTHQVGVVNSTTWSWAYPDKFIQVDLGERRWVDSVRLLYPNAHFAIGADVYVANDDGDDGNFKKTEDSIFAHLFAAQGRTSEIRLAPVKARYIRLTNVERQHASAHLFVNQIMVMGCEPPPPTGMLILVR